MKAVYSVLSPFFISDFQHIIMCVIGSLCLPQAGRPELLAGRVQTQRQIQLASTTHVISFGSFLLSCRSIRECIFINRASVAFLFRGKGLLA